MTPSASSTGAGLVGWLVCVEIAATAGEELLLWPPGEFSTGPLLCVSPEVGSLLESLMEGDFQAVLRNQHILDLLTGDGGGDEDIEAYLEGRVSRYLTSGPCEDQRTR